MTDIAAAIGIHQLRRVDQFQASRQDAARRYREALQDLPIDLPPEAAAGDTHAWHLFIIKLRAGSPISRDAAIEALGAAGISCSVHYRPLHKMTYWRETHGLRDEDFPNASRAFEGAISLPLYVGMSDDEIGHVAAALRRILS
jgi:dTDP-4-amino-4,6-dideoxygalactose transaminase